MAWYKQKIRHSIAAKKGWRKRKSLTAPLKHKSTRLPIQLSVTVPSTRFDKKVAPKTFNNRIKNTAKEMSNRFGGDTVIKGKGDYTSGGKLIREDVAIIESSMTKKDYKKNKAAIENFIKRKKRDWDQESIGYKYEDDFYIYPKF